MFEKKYPRLLLAHKEEDYKPIEGVRIQWTSNKQFSQVLDLSYAGVAVSTSGILSGLKLNELTDVLLHVESGGVEQEVIPLTVKIVRVQAGIVGLKIHTTEIAHRLRIEQTIKDKIIENNTRVLSTEALHPVIKANYWWHGPFDTNIFIWKSSHGGIEKAFIEFDDLILSYENDKVVVFRSSSASVEQKGYAAPYMISNPTKVSKGKSWSSRFAKVLTAIEDSSGILESLKVQVLKESIGELAGLSFEEGVEKDPQSSDTESKINLNL